LQGRKISEEGGETARKRSWKNVTKVKGEAVIEKWAFSPYWVGSALSDEGNRGGFGERGGTFYTLIFPVGGILIEG